MLSILSGMFLLPAIFAGVLLALGWWSGDLYGRGLWMPAGLFLLALLLQFKTPSPAAWSAGLVLNVLLVVFLAARMRIRL